jgi:16S rRNA (uracil1498-N3)-methyltransferase
LSLNSALSSINLFIGPEGGLSKDEIEQARARGVQSVTVGPRIFRAETAGLVATSVIFFARGEFDLRD